MQFLQWLLKSFKKTDNFQKNGLTIAWRPPAVTLRTLGGPPVKDNQWNKTDELFSNVWHCITDIPATQLLYVTLPHSPKVHFLFSFHHIMISHVQTYSSALIWLLSLILLVGLSITAVMPVSYITHPSSPLLSSPLLSLSLSSPLPSSTSVCLCWWCVKTLQPASPAPLAAVKSNISALSPLQRHKTRFESIKNAGLFGLLVLINID